MKNFNIFLGVISMCLITSTQVYGQLLTESVDKIGSEIAEDIYTVIDDLEQAGQGLSFAVRSDLLVAADNIAQLVAKERSKTFQELNSTQQSVFTNTLLAIEKAKQGTDESLKEARAITNQVGADMSRLPFVEKTPFVTRYGPGFFVEGLSTYRIDVEGSRLGEPTPTLGIDNAKCNAKNTETSITFVCSGPAFSTEKPKYLDGKLTVYSKKRFLVGSRKARTYPVSVGLVPEKYADYVLNVEYETTVTKRVKRTQRNYHRNKHCEEIRRGFGHIRLQMAVELTKHQ